MNIPDFEEAKSPAELSAAMERLAPDGPVAIDTEFVGEKTFRPRLELVQLRDTAGRTLLVDAQACGDLAPLGRLLADESRLKLAHAAGQDIPILESATGAAPWPLFDTQLAAAMVGWGAQISYAAVVQEVAGESLGKKHTVSDWSRRPLSRDQLRYAALDVAHLHAAHERLSGLLAQRGRHDWFDEEQRQRHADARRALDAPEREEIHRSFKEWAKLKGRELAILRELALWREEAARREDLPRRVVMPDAGLVHLARFAPTTREAARDLRQVPPGPLNRRLDEILAVIARGVALPKDQWPKRPRTERVEIPPGITELAAAVLRTIADREEIAATLLATSSDLSTMVANRHRLAECDIPLLRGWRRELAGERVAGLLRGELAVYIDESGDLAVEER